MYIFLCQFLAKRKLYKEEFCQRRKPLSLRLFTFFHNFKWKAEGRKKYIYMENFRLRRIHPPLIASYGKIIKMQLFFLYIFAFQNIINMRFVMAPFKFADNSSTLKVTVTVFSSGCLQIGFGVLIIDYICNFLIWPPWL